MDRSAKDDEIRELKAILLENGITWPDDTSGPSPSAPSSVMTRQQVADLLLPGLNAALSASDGG